jgi:hypothetical protein
MKFTRARWLRDAGGTQIIVGSTRRGQVRMLATDGGVGAAVTDVARLTPAMADKLAADLHDCAEHSRGHDTRQAHPADAPEVNR